MKFEIIIDPSYKNYTIWSAEGSEGKRTWIKKLTCESSTSKSSVNKLVGKYHLEIPSDRQSLEIVFSAPEDVQAFVQKLQQFPHLKHKVSDKTCAIELTGDNIAKKFMDIFFLIDTIEDPYPFSFKSQMFHETFGFEAPSLKERYQEELRTMLSRFVKSNRLRHEDLKKAVDYAKKTGHPDVLLFLAKILQDTYNLHEQALMVRIEATRQPKVRPEYLALPSAVTADIKESEEALHIESDDEEGVQDTLPHFHEADQDPDVDNHHLSGSADDSKRTVESEMTQTAHTQKQQKRYLKTPEIMVVEALLTKAVTISSKRLKGLFEQGLDKDSGPVYALADQKALVLRTASRSSISAAPIEPPLPQDPKTLDQERRATLTMVLNHLKQYRTSLQQAKSDDPATAPRLAKVQALIGQCLDELTRPAEYMLAGLSQNLQEMLGGASFQYHPIKSDGTMDLVDRLLATHMIIEGLHRALRKPTSGDASSAAPQSSANILALSTAGLAASSASLASSSAGVASASSAPSKMKPKKTYNEDPQDP